MNHEKSFKEMLIEKRFKHGSLFSGDIEGTITFAGIAEFDKAKPQDAQGLNLTIAVASQSVQAKEVPFALDEKIVDHIYVPVHKIPYILDLNNAQQRAMLAGSTVKYRFLRPSYTNTATEEVVPAEFYLSSFDKDEKATTENSVEVKQGEDTILLKKNPVTEWLWNVSWNSISIKNKDLEAKIEESQARASMSFPTEEPAASVPQMPNWKN